MDFVEKARIRLNHWIEHNDQHQKDYEIFFRKLREAGKGESADHIRQMMALSAKGTDCLRRALDALDIEKE